MKPRSELSRARCPAALPRLPATPRGGAALLHQDTKQRRAVQRPLRGQGTQADSRHCRTSDFRCPRRTLHGDLAVWLRPQAASGRLQHPRPRPRGLLRAPGLSGGAGFTPQRALLSSSWPHSTESGRRGRASNNSIARNGQTRSAYSAINHRHSAAQRMASL